MHMYVHMYVFRMKAECCDTGIRQAEYKIYLQGSWAKTGERASSEGLH